MFSVDKSGLSLLMLTVTDYDNRAPLTSEFSEALLDATQVCIATGWSFATLYRRVRAGTFPTGRRGSEDKRVRWPREVVMQHVEGTELELAPV